MKYWLGILVLIVTAGCEQGAPVTPDGGPAQDENMSVGYVVAPPESQCCDIHCPPGEVTYATGTYTTRAAVAQHMLFIHGMHGDGSVWNDWYNLQKPTNDAAGKLTRKPNLGYHNFYGKGAKNRDDWAADIANDIVNNMGSIPDNSLTLVTKSNGTIVALRMLEKGNQEFNLGHNNNWVKAAKKVKKMISIQGAFGGCLAGLGDGISHDGTSCGAGDTQKSLKQGDASSVMSRHAFTWAGTSWEKSIKFVVARGPVGILGINTLDRCRGHLDADLCRLDINPIDAYHDGQVHAARQVPPSSWPSSTRANQLITQTGQETNFCHGDGDEHPNAMKDVNLFYKYIGVTTTTTVHYCEPCSGPSDCNGSCVSTCSIATVGDCCTTAEGPGICSSSNVCLLI